MFIEVACHMQTLPVVIYHRAWRAVRPTTLIMIINVNLMGFFWQYGLASIMPGSMIVALALAE